MRLYTDDGATSAEILRLDTAGVGRETEAKPAPLGPLAVTGQSVQFVANSSAKEADIMRIHTSEEGGMSAPMSIHMANKFISHPDVPCFYCYVVAVLFPCLYHPLGVHHTAVIIRMCCPHCLGDTGMLSCSMCRLPIPSLGFHVYPHNNVW